MPTVAYQAPFFRNNGRNKEPGRGSLPVGTGATFFEKDFLVLSTAGAPPQVNGSVVAPPTSIDATIANSGGTIAAGTYLAAIGYVNANGTTPPGPTEALTTTGTGAITVISPPPSGDATGYRLYASAAGGSALFLQGTTVAIGTGASLTAPPSTSTAAPTTNTTGLPAPLIPALSAGGTTGPAGASTAFVVITYVNEDGETTASPEASQALTSGQLLTVTTPIVSGDASGYNVYVGPTTGSEVKQNTTPIAVGTNWVEPTTGFVLQGVQRAVTNQPPTINGLPAILGLADHDYNATYGGPVGGVQPGLSDAFGRPQFNQTVFGVTEVYPGISTEPKNAHFIPAQSSFEISLVQAWDGVTFGQIGQQGGLVIDTATNFFVFDLSASNKVAVLTAGVDGPGRGGNGDTGKRVAISILGNAAVVSG